jgi:hypothetical protein
MACSGGLGPSGANRSRWGTSAAFTWRHSELRESRAPRPSQCRRDGAYCSQLGQARTVPCQARRKRFHRSLGGPLIYAPRTEVPARTKLKKGDVNGFQAIGRRSGWLASNSWAQSRSGPGSGRSEQRAATVGYEIAAKPIRRSWAFCDVPCGGEIRLDGGMAGVDRWRIHVDTCGRREHFYQEEFEDGVHDSNRDGG